MIVMILVMRSMLGDQSATFLIGWVLPCALCQADGPPGHPDNHHDLIPSSWKHTTYTFFISFEIEQTLIAWQSCIINIIGYVLGWQSSLLLHPQSRQSNPGELLLTWETGNLSWSALTGLSSFYVYSIINARGRNDEKTIAFLVAMLAEHHCLHHHDPHHHHLHH